MKDHRPPPHVRVTVVLREPALDPDEEPGYLCEWVHEIDDSTDEDGCRLKWGNGSESYFPWTSVLRVNWETCDCYRCQSRRDAAATA